VGGICRSAGIARPLRIEFAGALCHVISRGNGDAQTGRTPLRVSKRVGPLCASHAVREPAHFSAASTVWAISVAMVIGPTPPGTGV